MREDLCDYHKDQGCMLNDDDEPDDDACVFDDAEIADNDDAN